jgi:tetratricopeptide (TPR) repeat protein/tRNA A-37 threonylcarbamoyl transferase component Bud32
LLALSQAGAYSTDYLESESLLSDDLLQQIQSALGQAYRIEQELGGGGMSRVFLAEEIELGRKVVVKVLPPEMAAGVSNDRFRREMQLAAKLQHPHIVPLLSAGSAGELLYYTMPFIEGESLRAKLAREGELPVAETVHILREVTDALSHAHTQGIVHRDIKPDNVLLSGKHALVTDFGVAKAVVESSGKSTLTSMGVALGTPAYMSPEQATADPHTDHRADIYAVGVLAYEMLSGRLPFEGSSPQAVIAAHVTENPVPITKHRGTVPAPLADTVMRCLEKKPADRWQQADELHSQLATMTTPSGGMTPTGTAPLDVRALQATRQGHPVRVTILFTLAAALVLGLVYLLMVQLGLPGWVLPAAGLLLAIGLPIMLVTGHVERHRAIAQTTRIAPGDSARGWHGWLSWRKATIGGIMAFAGLGILSATYMGMRLLGIGPVGTLVASGALQEQGRIIVADFENRTADSTLGPSVSDAFRIDLAQSPVVRVMDASAISEALDRMERDPILAMDLPLAREVAEREGAMAVVAGEISPIGQGYVLSARLLAAPGGEELVALRETAADDGGIIPAIDRLSVKLRERIGESFKSLRAKAPLERVTTGSLPALRKYSEAVRVFGRGDYDRVIPLLEEAIALDTAFAMAHRKLAVTLGNTFGDFSKQLEAATKAYRHRDRLPEIERYQASAYYHLRVEYDLSQVEAAYRSILALDPDNSTALNNLALVLSDMKRDEESEEFAARAAATGMSWTYTSLLSKAQYAQGKIAEAHATIDSFSTRNPENPQAARLRVWLAGADHDYEAASAEAQSLAASPSLFFESGARFSLYVLAQVQGKLDDAERQIRRFIEIGEERELPSTAVFGATRLGEMQLVYRNDPTKAIQTVEAMLDRYPLSTIQATSRPYSALARFYSQSGQVEKAKHLLDEYESAVPDGVRRGDPFRHAAEGAVAMVEGRAQDAIGAFRRWFDEAGLGCRYCKLAELGRAFELAGQTDSALATYERAVSSPDMLRQFGEEVYLPATYQRLGELYEEQGNAEKALEYYGRFTKLWKDADPELQPRVREIKQRMADLAGESSS